MISRKKIKRFINSVHEALNFVKYINNLYLMDFLAFDFKTVFSLHLLIGSQFLR